MFLPASPQKSFLKAQLLLVAYSVNSYWKTQPHTRYNFLPCKCFGRVHREDEVDDTLTLWVTDFPELNAPGNSLHGSVSLSCVSFHTHLPLSAGVACAESELSLGLSLFDFLVLLCVDD